MSASVSNLAAEDEALMEAARRAHKAYYADLLSNRGVVRWLWDHTEPADKARWAAVASAVLGSTS